MLAIRSGVGLAASRFAPTPGPSRRREGRLAPRFPTRAKSALPSQMDTHAPPPPQQRQPQPDHTHWTAPKAAAFLKLLACSGKVAPCARAVGMSRQSAYALRDRAPEFAKLWEVAMREAARQRALSGRVGQRGARANVHPLIARKAVAHPLDHPRDQPQAAGHHHPHPGRGEGDTSQASA